MLSYCLKCKENTERINPKVSKTNNSKTMLLWKYAMCGSKKSQFMKEEKGKIILSSQKTPWHKIQLFGDLSI